MMGVRTIMGSFSDDGPGMMHLKVLGDVGLWRGSAEDESGEQGEPLLTSGKPLALLIYLAAMPRRRASREHLIGVLWSDRPPEDSRHILRQTLWYVKRRIGESLIRTDADEVVLDDRLTCDRDQFLSAVESGAVETALAVYHGDFIPQFAAPGATEFERWAEIERGRLRGLYVRCAEARARQLLALGHPRQAIEVARRTRDAAPEYEGMWRLLIEGLVASGDSLGASLEADALERYHETEGTTPDAATKSVLRLVRRSSEGGAEFSDERSLVGELVGREREFALVLSAWERAKRGDGVLQLGVISPPGLGKSRLLHDVALRLQSIRARVVTIKANAGQRSVPFSFVAELAGALAALPGSAGVSTAVAGSLVALNPALSATYKAAERESVSSDDALRTRTFALRELISAISEDSAVAIIIDDAHWIDAASRVVFSGAIQGLLSERLLFVVASRPNTPSTLATSAPMVQLEPLSVADIEALITSLGELPYMTWATTFAIDVHSATGGVPLLVVNLLQSLIDRGVVTRENRRWFAASSDGLSAALASPGQAWRTKLERVSSDGRAMLVLLGVAGEPLSVAMIASALGANREATNSLAEELEHQGLVRRVASGVELTHDTLSDAVLEDVGANAERNAHLSLGRVLLRFEESTPFGLVRAGQHLSAAGVDDELVLVLERLIAMAQRSGDRRRVDEHVRDVVGSLVPAPRVEHLQKATKWRLNRGRRRMMVLLGALVVAAGAWGVMRPVEAAAVKPEASLMLLHIGDREEFAVRVDLTSRMFLPITNERKEGAGSPINVGRSGVPVRGALGTPYLEDVRISENPISGVWASRAPGRVISRLGIHDPSIAGSQLSYLVRHPGKLGFPTWAPDGSEIAFTRERYEGDGSDIAFVEVHTKRVRTLSFTSLTRGSERDVQWSPDGTRLAFVHASSDSAAGDFCWTSVDGQVTKCGYADGKAISVQAWEDSRNVLVELSAKEGKDLVRVDIESGTLKVVERRVSEIVASPDGHWLLRECARPRCPAGWEVGPTGKPEVARPLVLSKVDDSLLQRWMKDSVASAKLGVHLSRPTYLLGLVPHWYSSKPQRPYVASLGLEMVPPMGRRLVVHVEDQYGRPISTGLLQRRALDPDMATFADSENLEWKQTKGVARFVFTAGGWKADTAILFAPSHDSMPPAAIESLRMLREAYRKWGRSDR